MQPVKLADKVSSMTSTKNLPEEAPTKVSSEGLTLIPQPSDDPRDPLVRLQTLLEEGALISTNSQPFPT